MAKMSLSVKKELLAVYKQERMDMRCKVVKRESILKNAKLTVFERGYKVCALDEMHPELLKFDAETVRGTRKILEE